MLRASDVLRRWRPSGISRTSWQASIIAPRARIAPSWRSFRLPRGGPSMGHWAATSRGATRKALSRLRPSPRQEIKSLGRPLAGAHPPQGHLAADPKRVSTSSSNRHPLPLALASNAIVGACVSWNSRNAGGENSLPLLRIDWPWGPTSASRSRMNADIILVCVKKNRQCTESGAATLRAVAIRKARRKACAV